MERRLFWSVCPRQRFGSLRDVTRPMAPAFEYLQSQGDVIPQPGPTRRVSGPPSHEAQRVAIPAGNLPGMASLQAANPYLSWFPGRCPGLRDFGLVGPGEWLYAVAINSATPNRPLPRWAWRVVVRSGHQQCHPQPSTPSSGLGMGARTGNGPPRCGHLGIVR